MKSLFPVVDALPSPSRQRSRTALAPLAFGLLAASAACNQSYAVVTVELGLDGGKSVPQIYQIQSTATDGTSTNLATGPLEQDPIAFPKTYVIKLPNAATSLQVLVEGLDLNSNIALRGLSQPKSFPAGSSEVPISVTLTKPCATTLDCAGANVCSGASICTVAPFETDAGACVNPDTPAPLAFGTPCDTAGGRCDAHLDCVSPWHYCGDGNQDGGPAPLPDGGLLARQCDWGTPDGGCTGPDDECNANAANHCHLDCTAPTCGDGYVDSNERCDLGPRNGKAVGCNATCTLFGNATVIAGNGDVYPDGGQCVFECTQDGPGASAMFDEPTNLAVVAGTLYVVESTNFDLRGIQLTPPYMVSTVAGNPHILTNRPGVGTNAGFIYPIGVVAFQGNLLVGTLSNIEEVALPSELVTTFAGPDGGDSPSEVNGPFAQAHFSSVSALAYDGNDTIYDVDQTGGTQIIRKLSVSAGEVSTILGNTSSEGYFVEPYGMVLVDGQLFVTDNNENLIKSLDVDGGGIRTVAGSGEAVQNGQYTDCDAASVADGKCVSSFSYPYGMCTDGKTIYLMDGHDHAVRQIDPLTSAVTTVVNDAGLDNPNGCAWDPDAGVLYISDDSATLSTPDTGGRGNKIWVIR
ncbi:MAG TPA: hypothetical protein VMB50_02045 [Myxococcales bacterium]|nr:hypothetical protein [Myxococcales bacterium]